MAEDRSAGRWCAECKQHGSHHTDKHAEFSAERVDADVLTEAIRAVTDLWDEPLDEVRDVPPIVNAVLAALAPLLAVHVRAAKAEALREARDDIKARIDTFSRLDADPQYMNALDDAWGLVSNRMRDAARDATYADWGTSRGVLNFAAVIARRACSEYRPVSAEGNDQ